MDNQQPLISIVIPLYNKEQSIEASIYSVLQQSYNKFELLVVDDGSSDRSAEIVKSIVDKRISYMYKENGGVSSARNLGITSSKGEWILFLDADDTLLPNCLVTLLNSTKKYNSNMAVGNFYTKLEVGLLKLYNKGIGNHLIRLKFVEHYIGFYCPRCGAYMVKSSILKRFRFDENISRYEDAGLLVDLFKSCKISYCKEPVMIYDLKYNNLSKNVSNIHRDFVSKITFNNTSFGERLFYYWLLDNVWNTYSHEKLFLDKQYGSIKWKICVVHYISWLVRCMHKINLMINK